MTDSVPGIRAEARRRLADTLRHRLVAHLGELASPDGRAISRRRIVAAVIAAARNRSPRAVSRRVANGGDLSPGLQRDLESLFAELPGGDPDLRGFLIAAAADATLSPRERGAMGAVYTDAALARFTIREGLRALDERPRRMLDPACGAGAFLAEAALLLRNEEASLLGIDRDATALEAARARMGLLRETAPGVRCGFRARDALHIAPRGGFDLVIGNPPYVRQESIGGIAAKRALSARLERALPGAAAAMVPRADLAVAFLLMGLASLREGGVLAYVTTNAWLDNLYGRPLRGFLAGRAEVRLVAEWEGKAFDDAAANPVVAVIRRKEGPGRRAAVFASYTRAAVPRGACPAPPWRVRRRRADARRLAALDRWGATLLRGVDLLEEIIAREPAAFSPLGRIARLHYGTKTGLVDFFVLDADETEIEDRFLLPVLTSTSEIGALAVRPRDLPRRLFVCPLGREELSRGEHPGALAHVLGGETALTRRKARHTHGGLRYPDVPSVRGNAPWYRLKPRPASDFAIPLLIRARHMIVHAKPRIAATNMFYQGRFSDRALALPGAAILNSAVALLAIESLGRINIGGRINVYGPEIRALRVPDPVRMGTNALRAIAEAFEPLRRRPVGPVSEEAARPDRRALDLAVLEASGIGARYAPLLAEALEARVEGRLRRELTGERRPGEAAGDPGPTLAASAPLL